ncbi:hypothetical protein BRADO7063 [Bradyrhizobium sp. ORS 278]|uniref:hypothetical protein n=1 Tax=Bradyrhizobium sp. (strain ORS 278) TaxID=114615 RepID=UPI0001508626|nr:hypothetical protein [Bradyrhizobium sp. ORS 278]CAL80647.1 hypothetical protein BRADO7063 [Bradyrhizobium sp. ORS 278]
MSETIPVSVAPTDSPRSRRGIPLAIGGLTLLLSLWWSCADALSGRPRLAAEIGAVRTNLWKLAGASALSPGNTATDDAAPLYERAVETSPMDSEAWLGLATATERFSWINQRSSRALKMSYYTGAHLRSLMADRLLLMARIDSTNDPELRDMLASQTALILSRLPDLRPAIGRAYLAAGEANRRIIAQTTKAAGTDIQTLIRGN